MPKSFVFYAKDFNNDGKTDVFTLPDAIGLTLNYFGAKEGEEGIKNLGPYIQWYNPHDANYGKTIKRLAKDLEKKYDNGIVKELEEKINGSLLTKEKGFYKILEEKYFGSLNKENKRLWNFQYIIEHELDNLKIKN